MNDSVQRCAECGSELPPNVPPGLCPRCALSGVLATAPAESPAMPRAFGDYELLEEIARGGMGIVYKARQVNLDRIVAVKLLLLGQYASEEFIHRFRIEASAAASLQHPNIVAIHEVGVHQGQHYFAMEFVDGPDLAQLVRDQPLTAKRAAGYVKTIAEAIHFAHTRRILHRDLKPSNVLIDSNDQPRVTDFGLAKNLANDSELTLSGQVMGSPSFMPPEQALGERGKMGPASDVYSLGAILALPDLRFVAATNLPQVEDNWRRTLFDSRLELCAHDLAFNRAGSVLATASLDNTIRFWDTVKGRPLFELESWVTRIGFTADDRRLGLVVQHRQPGWIEWSASDVLWIRRRYTLDDWIPSLAFATGGDLIASSSELGLTFRDTRTGRDLDLRVFQRATGLFPGRTENEFFVSDKNGGWRLTLTNSENGNLRVARRESVLTGEGWQDIALTKDGKQLVALNRTREEVTAKSMEDGQVRGLVRGRHFDSAVASPDGRFITLPEARVVATLPARDGARLQTLSFSGDGSLLAAPTSRGELHLWNLKTLRARLGELDLDW